MMGIKGHSYTWNQSWIEFKAPKAEGVYCLLDKHGKVIFIGKGNIHERLLGHWNQENSTDAEIWRHAPAFFCFELTSQPAKREDELIQQLKPPAITQREKVCRPVKGFHSERTQVLSELQSAL